VAGKALPTSHILPNTTFRYLGWQNQRDTPPGLLLAQASHGSLQQCLVRNSNLSLSVRKKWCLQAAESIAYIHSRGVIHSDLRPENFLIHATTSVSLDLWLCDFGGSTCERLDLDGGHLPDSGFFDPKVQWVSTEQTDIFSLALVFYSILTGYWPYRTSVEPFKSGEEKADYERQVDYFFAQRKFPDVKGLFGGGIITKCWMNEYKSAEEVLQALKLEMGNQMSELNSLEIDERLSSVSSSLP
jgi:serine/threonine protein kinase